MPSDCVNLVPNPFKFGVVVNGKTSLILNLFDRLEGIESVYIDLMGITSINDFLDVYAHAFLEKIGGMQRFFELAKKIIPGIEKMELNFGPVGVDF